MLRENKKRGDRRKRDVSENGSRGGMARQGRKIRGMQLLSFMA